MDITEIIRENNKEIRNFKSNLLRVEMLNEEDSLHLSSVLLQSIYWSIDNTFSLLFSNNCKPKEKEIMVIQLEKLHNMFFGKLNTEYNFGYWQHFEEQEQEYYNYKHTFDPLNFQSDFILEQINKFKGNKEEIKSKPRNIENETWFKVAVQFANGNIYNNHNKGLKLKITDLANKFFIATEEVKIGTYRAYLSFTLSEHKEGVNKYKNIYYRKDAETELKKVVEYCINKKFEICPEFITICKEYKIYF